jgi:hypothetical protein
MASAFAQTEIERAGLRKKQEPERREYRDQFWSEAQNTPTRPAAPLK